MVWLDQNKFSPVNTDFFLGGQGQSDRNYKTELRHSKHIFETPFDNCIDIVGGSEKPKKTLLWFLFLDGRKSGREKRKSSRPIMLTATMVRSPHGGCWWGCVHTFEKNIEEMEHLYMREKYMATIGAVSAIKNIPLPISKKQGRMNRERMRVTFTIINKQPLQLNVKFMNEKICKKNLMQKKQHKRQYPLVQ